MIHRGDVENHVSDEDAEIAEIQQKLKMCLRWMWVRGRRNARKNTINNWLMTIATWGAFIAACIYAYLAGGQLKQMRIATTAATMSADTARDTLVRSQRPWLVNDGPATYKVGDVYKDQDMAGVTFSFQIKNFGPAPALDAGFGLQPFIRTAGDMHDFDNARKQACQLADGVINVSSQTIFPQQTVNYTTGGFIPSFGKVQVVLFYGCIAYRDQFDTGHTTHHTTFCVFGPIKEPHSLALCGVNEIAN
jgi:hypothetical protein